MDGSGTVRIEVRKAAEGRLDVRILDDGIGVKHSLEAKNAASGDHISRGIEITKGRADVLRRLDLTDIRITGPEERVDPTTGRTIGTQVLVSLPMTNGWKKEPQVLHSV
jgi:nitrate/nitrite-specific signal transduction histidine kinase